MEPDGVEKVDSSVTKAELTTWNFREIVAVGDNEELRAKGFRWSKM